MTLMSCQKRRKATSLFLLADIESRTRRSFNWWMYPFRSRLQSINSSLKFCEVLVIRTIARIRVRLRKCHSSNSRSIWYAVDRVGIKWDFVILGFAIIEPSSWKSVLSDAALARPLSQIIASFMNHADNHEWTYADLIGFLKRMGPRKVGWRFC